MKSIVFFNRANCHFRSLLSALIFFAVIVSGCGGGGGGDGAPGGGGVPPQEPESESEVVLGLGGPGDVDSLFPLDAGNYWHYRALEDNTLAYHDSASVLETRDINGISGQVLLETNSYNEGSVSESYYVADPNGIANLGSDSPGDPAVASGEPFWELKFPLTIGDHFVQLDREGLSFGEDIDGDAIHETFDIRSEVTVEAEEDVSVPAGDFPNAIRIRRDVDMSVSLSSDNSLETISAIERVWYASGVGRIKRASTVGLGDNSQTATEELDVYRVGGVSVGIASLSADSAQGEVQTLSSNVYIYPATSGEQYLCTIGGLDGDADIIPYLPDHCLMGTTNRPGNQDESCLVKAVDGRIIVAVKGMEQSSYTLSVNAVPTITTPGNEGSVDDPVIIQPGVPTIGQVATRGASYYAAIGLDLGDYNISIASLSADADLHIYMDSTYSLELDCTLRAPGDTGTSSEDCTVSNVGELYFSVTGGELNRDGATYFIAISGL